MISWMHPQWAWAGLSVLLPLLIHLWNKKVRKKKKVGFVGLYVSVEQAKSSRIQWQDILLMLLRMAILALLTVYLMKPVFQQSPKKIGKVYVIDPQMETQWLEGVSILATTEQVFWLHDEVIPFTEAKPELKDELPNYWKTLKEWSRKGIQADTVVLFTHGQRKHFPFIAYLFFPFHIEWKLIPLEASSRYLISRIPQGDSLFWKIGYWQDEQWKVKDSISQEPAKLPVSLKTLPHSIFFRDTVRVRVMADKQHEKEKEFLRDALEVAADFSFKTLVFTESDSADWLFVLSKTDSLPPHCFRVLYEPQTSAKEWLQIRSDSLGRYWSLQKPLEARSSPSANDWLLVAEELLRALNWDEEGRIIRQEADDRMIDPETWDIQLLEAAPTVLGNFQWEILGFLLLLLTIERIYAYRKRV